MRFLFSILVCFRSRCGWCRSFAKYGNAAIKLLTVHRRPTRWSGPDISDQVQLDSSYSIGMGCSILKEKPGVYFNVKEKPKVCFGDGVTHHFREALRSAIPHLNNPNGMLSLAPLWSLPVWNFWSHK